MYVKRFTTPFGRTTTFAAGWHKFYSRNGSLKNERIEERLKTKICFFFFQNTIGFTDNIYYIPICFKIKGV